MLNSKKIAIALTILVILFSISSSQPYGEIIGTTLLPQQNAGPTGRRITVCDDNSIYVCWINSLGWPEPMPRYVFMNWRSPDGCWAGEIQVSGNSGAGYCNVDYIYGNRGAFAYHEISIESNIFVAIEWDPPGYGFFDYFQVPNNIYPQTPDHPGICLWPVLNVDYNNRMHVVMTEITDRLPKRFCYSRSNDGGFAWLSPIEIDTLEYITGGIVSSPVSDRVAITYLNPMDTSDQYNFWPFYVISEDGENWNVPDDIEQVPYPFTPGNHRWGNYDHTAIFDNNDNLHIAWPVYGDSSDWLLHYDSYTDSIGVITQIYAPPNHPLIFPMIEQASLSRRRNSPTLFATWCQFANGDTNAVGEYNGDIYFNSSDDFGISWSEPVNVTNSPSPGCSYMECTSEIYPTVPEEVDSMPQFTYIYDPFINPDDLPDSQYAVMYLEPDDLVGISGGRDILPSAFAIYQNYPNPFNARTTISYEIPIASNVRIEIFDILGRKLETLVNHNHLPGSYSIVWNAQELPSGVYLYKIQTGDFSQTRKCLLIK